MSRAINTARLAVPPMLLRDLQFALPAPVVDAKAADTYAIFGIRPIRRFNLQDTDYVLRNDDIWATGSYVGGFVVQQTGPNIRLADGSPTMAVGFDGRTGFGVVPGASAFNVTGHVLAYAWGQTTVTSAQMIAAWASAGAGGWEMYVNSGFLHGAIDRTGGNAETVVGSAVRVDDGQWHFFMIARNVDSAAFIAYVDGSVVGCHAVAQRALSLSHTGSVLTIGKADNGQWFFNGQLSVVTLMTSIACYPALARATYDSFLNRVGQSYGTAAIPTFDNGYPSTAYQPLTGQPWHPDGWQPGGFSLAITAVVSTQPPVSSGSIWQTWGTLVDVESGPSNGFVVIVNSGKVTYGECGSFESATITASVRTTPGDVIRIQVTHATSQVALYINGSSVSASTTPASWGATISQRLGAKTHVVGGGGVAGFLGATWTWSAGFVRDVYGFGRCLTATEVKQLNSGLP